jgi:hypothetical protein
MSNFKLHSIALYSPTSVYFPVPSICIKLYFRHSLLYQLITFLALHIHFSPTIFIEPTKCSSLSARHLSFFQWQQPLTLPLLRHESPRERPTNTQLLTGERIYTSLPVSRTLLKIIYKAPVLRAKATMLCGSLAPRRTLLPTRSTSPKEQI